MIIILQIFSVLFFLMLYILGIGSGVGIIGGVIAIINDQFPHWKEWPIVIVLTVIGFIIGIVYCTPVSENKLFFQNFNFIIENDWLLWNLNFRVVNGYSTWWTITLPPTLCYSLPWWNLLWYSGFLDWKTF